MVKKISYEKRREIIEKISNIRTEQKRKDVYSNYLKIFSEKSDESLCSFYERVPRVGYSSDDKIKITEGNQLEIISEDGRNLVTREYVVKDIAREYTREKLSTVRKRLEKDFEKMSSRQLLGIYYSL